MFISPFLRNVKIVIKTYAAKHAIVYGSYQAGFTCFYGELPFCFQLSFYMLSTYAHIVFFQHLAGFSCR